MSLKPVSSHNDDHDQEIEAALANAMQGEAKPQPLARTLIDQNITNIETVIGKLRSREIGLEQEIAAKMEDLRQTRRSIAAFQLTLRMLA
jgi:hypothetical protein